MQRKCACGGQAKAGGECEQCQKKTLQRKSSTTASGSPSLAPPIVHDVLRTPGRPLDSPIRAPMEGHFGHDFSRVRIHTDGRAIESAREVHARAYTVGRHVVFGEAPDRALMAHELAHVVQQSGSPDIGPQIEIGSVDDPRERQAEVMASTPPTRSAMSKPAPGSASNLLQRTVAGSSNCPANVHNAPADPIAALERFDSRAQLMSLGSSHLLFVESLTFADPTFGPSEIYDAYRDWFGTPRQTSSGRWLSRFLTAPFATENEATRHEMGVLSDRFERLHRWLSRDIRYVCPGTSVYTIPGCAAGRCTNDAQSCSTGARRFGICPTFWIGTTDDGRASLLIHEAIHARFGFPGHPTSTPAGRARNPGCYQGFVDTIYNTGALPTDCAPLP